MDGKLSGPTKFGFGHSIIAEQHWAVEVTPILQGVLLLLTLYLVIRSLFTRSNALPSAPAHIRNSEPILKWIAAFAVLLSMLGNGFFLYDEMGKIMIDGRYHPDQIAYPLGQIIVLSLLGLLVSTAAMLGLALIFIQKLWRNR